MRAAKRSPLVWAGFACAALIALVAFLGFRAFSAPSVNISEKFEAGSTPTIDP